MKKLVILAALLASLSGCVALRPLTAPVVAVVRADVQTAHDSATAAGDAPGVQCHALTLASLDVLEHLAAPPVRGIASAAEALRIKRQMALNLAPMLARNAEACASVYDVMSLLRPMLAGWGM